MSEKLAGDAPRLYVIASTPRSGTTYLGSLLAQTGVLGNPEEWVGSKEVVDRFGVDFDVSSCLDLLITRGRTNNGVVALKLFTFQMQWMLANGGTFSQFRNVKWIYMWREDLVSQAISLVRAHQSGLWTSGHAIRGQIRYDRDAIGEAITETANRSAQWKVFFARNGIRPLNVKYENLVADEASSIQKIAEFVGVDIPVSVPRNSRSMELPLPKQQRDTTSADWRQRYIESCSIDDLSPFGSGPLPASRTFKNFMKFIRKRPLR